MRENEGQDPCTQKRELTSFIWTALDGAVVLIGTPLSLLIRILKIGTHWDILGAPCSAKTNISYNI
jgi:hypothetical protein